MRIFFLSFFLLSVSLSAKAQSPVQTLRGIVTDRDTKQPLPGVSIQAEAAGTGIQQSAVSDSTGAYTIPKFPTGRVRVKAYMMGYEPYISEDVILSSAKELVHPIELVTNPSYLPETVIKVSNNAFDPVNPLASSSVRSVSAEEIERVPTAANDPARAALSYPGVQKGEDEAENQIVVRGNSPTGILWRLEGIDIPNPNHFALIGSSGGGITAFSAQLFGPSDFLTGGMPAEYGNTLSGVFDIRFRQGNDEKREYRARIGVLGLDFSSEGPFRRGRSSYLINYRYSTLSILSRMGFNLVGERVSNDFQDLSFNLAFKSANQRHRLTVFGIGGLSEEHYYPVEDPAQRNTAILNHWEDRVKPANVGVLGATWTYLPDDRSAFKTAIAFTGNDIRRRGDLLDLNDVRRRYETRRFREGRMVLSATYQRKLSETLLLKTGLILNEVFFDFFQNFSPRFANLPPQLGEGYVGVQGKGNTRQIQQYAQLQWRFAPRWTVQTGYHALFLAVNRQAALDPRFSLQYRASERHRFTLAAGLYSKTLYLPIYFVLDRTGAFQSRDLSMPQSTHLIAGWNWYAWPGGRFSAEVYGQSLHRVPIAADTASRYWMLNSSEDFVPDPLVSRGKGLNYGIDLALEQRFLGKWFFLLNGSLYRSKFRLAQGPWYASRFDSRFTSSATAGKEMQLGKRDVLQIGVRALWSGGFRYTPHDPELSAKLGYYVPRYNAAYEGQNAAYFRIDTRIAWRFNRNKTSGSVSLDMQNALNRANPFLVAYDPVRQDIYTQDRGELIPLLAFQLDF